MKVVETKVKLLCNNCYKRKVFVNPNPDITEEQWLDQSGWTEDPKFSYVHYCPLCTSLRNV